jgi:hypothetical protein
MEFKLFESSKFFLLNIVPNYGTFVYENVRSIEDKLEERISIMVKFIMSVTFL